MLFLGNVNKYGVFRILQLFAKENFNEHLPGFVLKCTCVYVLPYLKIYTICCKMSIDIIKQAKKKSLQRGCKPFFWGVVTSKKKSVYFSYKTIITYIYVYMQYVYKKKGRTSSAMRPPFIFTTISQIQ